MDKHEPMTDDEFETFEEGLRDWHEAMHEFGNGRTLKVLLARTANEADSGNPQTIVRHDGWCPSLRTKHGALLVCQCSPEITFEPEDG